MLFRSISRTGNIGIGTSTPLTLCHIYTATSNQAFLSIYGNGGGGNTSGINMSPWGAHSRPGGTATIIEALDDSNYSAHLLFLTASPGGPGSNTATERMRITSSGNVGVATTSPSTTLDVNGSFHSNNSGIGRYNAGLCTEEVQCNRLLACNSFYITPALTGIFYPVVFSTWPAGGTGQNPWKICIARTSVHQDATWKGALMSTFEGSSSVWGNGADYFKFQICGTSSGATYNYFIGNAYVDFTSGYLVVYLRGGTTYQYTCEGASLLYYPNASTFVSYTIPTGSGTVLYSTSTPTTPFNTTYYTYDSVTGLSGFSTGVDGGAVGATFNNGLTVQGTAIASLNGYETVDLTSGFLYTSYQTVSASLQVYGNKIGRAHV